MRPISFAQALRDDRLLGASFRDPSWRPWHVLARIISGEPFDAADIELVRRCTGRTKLPTRPRRLFLLVGRRGGKSRFLSALAVWLAALGGDWKRLQAPGEPAVVCLVGCDKRQARVLAEYANGLLQSPMLAPEVVRRAGDRIELRSGAVLEVVTNDHRLIRGRSAIAVLGDETCFWRADGESAASDTEVIAAATPALMTAPGGGYLVLSSTTYRKKGYLYDQWHDHFGNDASGDLVWLAPSRVMNASLPAAEIEAEIARDPIKNKAEYLSLWRDDISGFIPVDALAKATDAGVMMRMWSGNYADKYCAFVDSAAGAAEGNDSFCMAVCRGGPDGVVHVDYLAEFEPPFIPSRVVAEFVEVLRSYRLSMVTGDAAGWAASEFQRYGVTYFPSRPKSELYLSVLPMLLSGRLRLLDNAKLRRQFAALERSVRAGGREVIEEPLRNGSHDDVCNVVAGAAVTMAETLARQPISSWGGFGVVSAPRAGFPGSMNAEDQAFAASRGGSWFGPRGNGSLVW